MSAGAAAADDGTCAWCPRLCRHVCPVVVGTAWESATPTAIRSLLIAVTQGVATPDEGLAAASLCNGCGACESHCKHHVAVPARLRSYRVERGGLPAADPLGSVAGDARHVCILTSETDWAGAWGAREGVPVARLRTDDSLGHARHRAGDAAVAAAVGRLLAGRVAIAASGAVAEVLSAAGVETRRLEAPAAPLVFHACFEQVPAGPTQLACCGRREGFVLREPEAAAAVARENVRRFDGRPVATADEECACWLRAAGATIRDPIDALREPLP